MSKVGDLTINVDNLGGRINALFSDLLNDESRRQTFLENPFVDLSAIFPELDATDQTQALSAGNQFLKDALANDGFRDWASQYQHKLVNKSRENPDISISELAPRREALEQIGQALIEAGDPQLVAGWSDLLERSNSSSEEPVVTHEIAIAVALAVVIVVVISAIDITPYTDPHADVVTAGDVRGLADALAATAKRL